MDAMLEKGDRVEVDIRGGPEPSFEATGTVTNVSYSQGGIVGVQLDAALEGGEAFVQLPLDRVRVTR